MSRSAPDPAAIRAATLVVLDRLEVPRPPAEFPLTWEPGDEVALRPTPDLEARAAILNVLLYRALGTSPERAARWLTDAGLREHATGPEWRFIAEGVGASDTFILHDEALYALAWLLGLVEALDAAERTIDGLAKLFPDVPGGEAYASWRSRVLPAPRPAIAAAAVLDLYYCLDGAYQAAARRHEPEPGPVRPYVVGQRRWALEWAVVFTGPYHDPPPDWEDVDLTA